MPVQPPASTQYIKIGTWNCRGVRAQKEELIKFLCTNQIDIILWQETLLKAADIFKIPNYIIHRTDRENGRGGDTAILTKRNIKYSPGPIIDTPNLEATSGVINIDNQKLTICFIYRPPSIDITNEDLDAIFRNDDTPILAARDLNTKNPAWHSTRINQDGRTLLHHAQRINVFIYGPRVHTHFDDRPPYSSDVIDIFLAKNFTQPLDIETVSALNSDYIPVITSFPIQTFQLPNNNPTTFVNWPLPKHPYYANESNL